MDNAMAAGLRSPALPFARKEGLEILKGVYQSRAEAAVQIPASLIAYYRDGYPAVYHLAGCPVAGLACTVIDLFSRGGTARCERRSGPKRYKSNCNRDCSHIGSCPFSNLRSGQQYSPSDTKME